MSVCVLSLSFFQLKKNNLKEEGGGTRTHTQKENLVFRDDSDETVCAA